jgi:hypothetical protein
MNEFAAVEPGLQEVDGSVAARSIAARHAGFGLSVA